MAILHGGPLDGKVMPIHGRPEAATAAAPLAFVHVEKDLILYYNLRDEQRLAPVPGEIPGYHYDYSHAVPRHND
jgi:hypothetical protein